MGYIDSNTGRYVPNPYLVPHKHKDHGHRRHRGHPKNYNGVSLNQILLIFIGLLVFFGTIFILNK